LQTDEQEQQTIIVKLNLCDLLHSKTHAMICSATNPIVAQLVVQQIAACDLLRIKSTTNRTNGV